MSVPQLSHTNMNERVRFGVAPNAMRVLRVGCRIFTAGLHNPAGPAECSGGVFAYCACVWPFSVRGEEQVCHAPTRGQLPPFEGVVNHTVTLSGCDWVRNPMRPFGVRLPGLPRCDRVAERGPVGEVAAVPGSERGPVVVAVHFVSADELEMRDGGKVQVGETETLLVGGEPSAALLGLRSGDSHTVMLQAGDKLLRFRLGEGALLAAGEQVAPCDAVDAVVEVDDLRLGEGAAADALVPGAEHLGRCHVSQYERGSTACQAFSCPKILLDRGGGPCNTEGMTTHRFRKADIDFHSDMGRDAHAAINIKVHAWLNADNLARLYKGNGIHEASDDIGFWTWLDDMDERERDELLNESFYWACEMVYADVKEYVCETMDLGDRKVWQEGRSGGWMVADFNRWHVEEWDAIRVSAWGRCVKFAQAAKEDVGYQMIWTLRFNVYEGIIDNLRAVDIIGALV